jgi:hypothetical protein
MLNFSSSIAAPGQNFHATTDGSKFFAPQPGISLLPIGYQFPPISSACNAAGNAGIR